MEMNKDQPFGSMEDATDARWHDTPPEPGIYYWETCDHFGNPRPGFYVWEPGKEANCPAVPSRYFGPIRGAMQIWPMVPQDAE